MTLFPPPPSPYVLQDGLKESDRVLLEIFKQLESNVSELTASLSMLRAASSNTQSPGRPTSFTDLDFNVPRSPFCPNSSSLGGFNGLETILDSSKEDISYKTSTESDSLYLAEQESSSNSCSPVLPPLKSHASIPSINSSTGSNGGGGGAPKRPANPSPPLLKTSTSFSGRLANSPSIARLQDETSSNISRNSSIDSGIQFASEAENGSAQGVEAAMHTLLPPPPTREESGEAADTRKSMGFADDIFATLGMK